MINKCIYYGYGLNIRDDRVWQHIVNNFILPSCEIGAREETKPGKLWIDVYSHSGCPYRYETDFVKLPPLVYGKANIDNRDEYWSIKTSYSNFINYRQSTKPWSARQSETTKILFEDGQHRYLNRANDTDALLKFINDLIFTVPFATLSSPQLTVGQENISFLEFIVRSHKDHESEISTHLKHRLAQLVVTKYCNYISHMSDEHVVAVSYLCIAELPMLLVMIKNCESSCLTMGSLMSLEYSIRSRKSRRSLLIAYIKPQPVTTWSTVQQTFTTLEKFTNIVKVLTNNRDEFKTTLLWQKIEQGTIEEAFITINAALVSEIKIEEMKIQKLENEAAILSAKLAAPPTIFVKESVQN